MITREEVKRALKIPPSNTTRDGDLDVVVAAAINWLQSKTGHYFGSLRQIVQRIDGDGYSDRIYLHQAPAATPAPIVETWNGAAWIVTAAPDYEIDGTRIILLNGALWTKGTRNVRVTYSEGYASGQVPADDKRSALAVAVAMWKEIGRGDIQAENISGYSYTLKNENVLPTFVRETIRKYRRVRV